MGGEGSRGRDGPVGFAGKACVIKLLCRLTEGETWVLWSERVPTRGVSTVGRIASLQALGVDGMVLWPKAAVN